MGDDNITNALCRTWKVEKVRDIYFDKQTGEETNETVTPDNPGSFGNEMGYEVMFSKSGTYLISRLDGSIDLAEWKWRDRSKGTLYYAWDGDWTGDYATITFDGNSGRTIMDATSRGLTSWPQTLQKLQTHPEPTCPKASRRSPTCSPANCSNRWAMTSSSTRTAT